MYVNYQKYGVENYYKNHGESYKNPHFQNLAYIFPKILKEIPINPEASILDLACGSGEITQLLIKNGHNPSKIKGMDPYTSKNYEKTTGLTCLEKSFQDIIRGDLSEVHFDVIVCSYAVHLMKDEELFGFFTELASMTPRFIVISPNRKFALDHFRWKIKTETYYPTEKIKVFEILRVDYD